MFDVPQEHNLNNIDVPRSRQKGGNGEPVTVLVQGPKDGVTAAIEVRSAVVQCE